MDTDSDGVYPRRCPFSGISAQKTGCQARAMAGKLCSMMTVAANTLRLDAVMNRQSLVDDPFVYGVVTTGIYCRPDCPSRRAKAENIRLFDSITDAQQHGYRACKRCKPDATKPEPANIIVRACQMLRDAEAPDLTMLANDAGYSPAHFHKIFKRDTGLTPKAFQQAIRLNKLQDSLAAGEMVTRALFDAGFESASQGYDRVKKATGLTPAQFRRKGAAMDIKYTIRPCALGHIMVAGSPAGICRIALGDDPTALEADIKDRFAAARLAGADKAFDQWLDILVAWVALPSSRLDLPLDITATVFQEKVWTALRDIPPGSRISYAELATRIGQPTAMRAVANACGQNPVALVIPCHRVTRSDGDSGGYRWGSARKKQLLTREEDALAVQE